MKVIGVTDLRQRAAEVLNEVRGSDEPYVIVQRSEKAAYLVDAEKYEDQMAQLRAMRHELFWLEVREAEGELAAGLGSTFDNVDELLAALDKDRSG